MTEDRENDYDSNGILASSWHGSCFNIRRVFIERKLADMENIMPSLDLDNALVVITDYKRYSIALSWDCETHDAPKVIAKEGDVGSQALNEYANKKGIDVFESPFLACMLCTLTDVGNDISKEHYYPVAHIIAFVINSRWASDNRPKRPKPDKYILRDMGLIMKTAIQN